MEAIVLAGGYGTRLQKLISEVPKPMAPINGRPFLEYLLNYLNFYEIQNVILSVGFKYEIISDYFKNRYKELNISYSIENEPLGTGGGIIKASGFTKGNDFFVINGDTLFDIDLNYFYACHNKNNSDVSIALKELNENKRYGSVKIDNNRKVIGFIEKNEDSSQLLINGGIYLINKNKFDSLNFPEKFSFEKDFLEKYYHILNIYGLPFKNYFLDIGIPEDYELAQKEFRELKY